jgi:hypothetical protein
MIFACVAVLGAAALALDEDMDGDDVQIERCVAQRVFEKSHSFTPSNTANASAHN